MDFLSFRPWLRDGVDVYISSDSTLHFVFLSIRKRIQVRADPSLVSALEWLDGSKSVGELEEKFILLGNDRKIGPTSLVPFLEYLHDHGILVSKNWIADALEHEEAKQFERQINFFLDIEGSEEGAIRLFKRLSSAHLVIFGMGAIGSWIATELIQMGVRTFTIIDPGVFTKDDVARHAFFSESRIGHSKAETVATAIRSSFLNANVKSITRHLDVHTDIENLIGCNYDMIINTADEPYVGATSLKLSRYSISKRKPLLVAGGFDAHLGSLGELIVPGETPCSDCYANYFEEALQNWKPYPHPVVSRENGFGGVAPLCVFSASAAVIKLLRYFMTKGGEVDCGRGEFLFDDYSIDSFEVNRDPKCQACSNLV